MANSDSPTITSVRLDKWLWATRFFKTRSQAGDACQGEKIKRKGKALKPSAAIKIGDQLQVSKHGLIRDIEVRELIVKRVAAPIAESCYIDHTQQDRIDAHREAHAAANAHRPSGAGRPTKRDRREIDALKRSLKDMGYGR